MFSTHRARRGEKDIAYHDGVGVIILRNDGKVLLGSRKGSHGANTWAFPGGHLEAGETSVECAQREAMEETDLCLTQLCIGPTTMDWFEDIDVGYRTHFVIAKYDGGEPDVNEPDKCEQWCWFHWEEIVGLQDHLFKPIQSLLELGIGLKYLRSVLYAESLRATPYRLVAFDLDGTLVRNTTTTLYFAELLQVKDAVVAVEADLAAKRIDSTGFMHEISTIMASLSMDFIDTHLAGLPFIRDIQQTIELLRRFNITTVIITAANQMFADAIRRQFGFDYAFGTQFEIKHDGTLGKGMSVCSGPHKIQHARKLAQLIGISMREVVAVGDSLSDVPLFTQAGHSIALNYDKNLEGRADAYLYADSLLAVLGCLTPEKTITELMPPKKLPSATSYASFFHGDMKPGSYGDIYAQHTRKRIFSRLESFELIEIILTGNIDCIEYIFKHNHYQAILPDDLFMLSSQITGEELPARCQPVLLTLLSRTEVLSHFGSTAKTIIEALTPSPMREGDEILSR